MDKMINYIFGNLQSSSDSIKSIKKTLKTQAKFNRTLNAFAFTIIIYALMAKTHNYGQDKKIEELSKEIEELKRMKGE